MNLLTPEEVAERLAVSPKIVRQWLRDGKLPGIRLGRLWRVNPDALEKVLREGFGDWKPPKKTATRRKPPETPKASPRSPKSRKGEKRAHTRSNRARVRKGK